MRFFPDYFHCDSIFFFYFYATHLVDQLDSFGHPHSQLASPDRHDETSTLLGLQ